MIWFVLVGLDLIAKSHLYVRTFENQNILWMKKQKLWKAENPSNSLLCQANHQNLSISSFLLPSVQPNSPSNFTKMSDLIHRRKVPTPIGNGGRSFRARRTASRSVSDKNRSKSTNRIFERSFSESSLHRRRDGESNYLRLWSPSMSSLQTEESSDPIVNLQLHRIRSEVFASSPSLSSGFSSPSSPSPINQEVRICFKSKFTISSPHSLNTFLFNA